MLVARRDPASLLQACVGVTRGGGGLPSDAGADPGASPRHANNGPGAGTAPGFSTAARYLRAPRLGRAAPARRLHPPPPPPPPPPSAPASQRVSLRPERQSRRANQRRFYSPLLPTKRRSDWPAARRLRPITALAGLLRSVGPGSRGKRPGCRDARACAHARARGCEGAAGWSCTLFVLERSGAKSTSGRLGAARAGDVKLGEAGRAEGGATPRDALARSFWRETQPPKFPRPAGRGRRGPAAGFAAVFKTRPVLTVATAPALRGATLPGSVHTASGLGSPKHHSRSPPIRLLAAHSLSGCLLHQEKVRGALVCSSWAGRRDLVFHACIGQYLGLPPRNFIPV